MKYRCKTNDVNLCDSCINRWSFPECVGQEVEFGSGYGDDNIIQCEAYDPEILPDDVEEVE